MMQKRFFLIGLWTILAVLAILRGFPTAWPINHWSVAYLGQRIDINPTKVMETLPENHPRAKIWLAEDALKAGRFEDALTLLNKQVHGNDSLALRMWGNLLVQKGDLLKAIDTWVLVKDRSSLLDIIEVNIGNKELSMAEIAYQGLFQVQPEETVWPYAEFLAHRMNDYSTAEAVLIKSLIEFKKSPKNLEWKYRLGQLYSEENRLDDAIWMFKEILLIDPNHYWALINLGKLTYGRGDGLDHAIYWFNRAIEINPNQGDAYYYIAQVFMREKEFQEADAWYSKAIAKNPQERWWWLERANNDRSAGRYDLAEQRYQETLANFPEWAHVHYELAWNYKMSGDKVKAQERIEKALALEPMPNTLYYQRAGQIYEWVGNNEKALSVYKAILVIDSDNSAAIEAIQRLETHTYND